jgi:hypothetical protein
MMRHGHTGRQRPSSKAIYCFAKTDSLVDETAFRMDFSVTVFLSERFMGREMMYVQRLSCCGTVRQKR